MTAGKTTVILLMKSITSAIFNPEDIKFDIKHQVHITGIVKI